MISKIYDNEIPDLLRQEIPYVINYEQSQNQAFYFIKEINISGIPINENDWVVAYNNDEIVGARKWFG